jgi:hypothetical protein
MTWALDPQAGAFGVDRLCRVSTSVLPHFATFFHYTVTK